LYKKILEMQFRRKAVRRGKAGKHGWDVEGTYFQVYDLELAEEVLSYYSVDRDSD
jgi:hypothetical protein